MYVATIEAVLESKSTLESEAVVKDCTRTFGKAECRTIEADARSYSSIDSESKFKVTESRLLWSRKKKRVTAIVDRQSLRLHVTCIE